MLKPSLWGTAIKHCNKDRCFPEKRVATTLATNMSLKVYVRGGEGGVKVGTYWKMKEQESVWFRLFFISIQAITLRSIVMYTKAREHLFSVN